MLALMGLLGTTTIVSKKQTVRVPSGVMQFYNLSKGDRFQWWTEGADIPDLAPNLKEGEVIIVRVMKKNAKQVSVSDEGR